MRGVIHDRDVAIGEKEKKIYELKKRNQELEKFKFVLDYKIKELKRQIEPRENEIADMRVQIKEVCGLAALRCGVVCSFLTWVGAVFVAVRVCGMWYVSLFLSAHSARNRWTRSWRRTTVRTQSWT